MEVVGDDLKDFGDALTSDLDDLPSNDLVALTSDLGDDLHATDSCSFLGDGCFTAGDSLLGEHRLGEATSRLGEPFFGALKCSLRGDGLFIPNNASRRGDDLLMLTDQ